MPLSWCGGNGEGGLDGGEREGVHSGVEMSADEKMTWRRLHTQFDLFARPVLELLWGACVCVSGAVCECV